MHFSVDTDVACHFSECELAWFLIFTFMVTHTVACLVSGGELVNNCVLLVIQSVAHLVLGCELAWFSMCTSLVTETSLAPGCEFTWFVMCTFLVTQTVACLVSARELA